MNRRSELTQAIARDQQADGSFLSLSVPAGGAFGPDATGYTTTFTTATIALAIAGIEDDQLEEVRQKAVDWLLAQAGPQWSFNYWPRQAAEAQMRPYPDDWDDTSCALAAITRIRPQALTGTAMARVVTLLTNTEMQEGGPYRTWIVDATADKHWQDVDVAVNANIAYLLSLHEVSLPRLEALTEEAIGDGKLASPYYPSAYPLVYFLARWYRGERRDELAKLVLGQPDNILQAALAVTSAVRLGVEPGRIEALVRKLRAAKLATLTAPQAFCFDPAIDGKPYVAGSGALTAAFCLEALHCYEQTRARGGQVEQRVAKRIHEKVVDRVMSRYVAMPVEIRRNARRIHERVLDNDPAGQVTLLPYLFREAMGTRGRGISDERLVQLGVNSLYGWLAYTIYDDFLDHEGEPVMLPLANVALRELALALEHDPAGPAFVRLARRTLDRMEAANVWEVSNCRVTSQRALLTVVSPDYGDLSMLANRSMGHALGALALAAELGRGPGSPEREALVGFFHHLLIARQLNDEAHDWKQDLQNGHINAVGAMLLTAIPKRGRSVSALYAQLEKYFWTHLVVQVCDKIFGELAAARQALDECRLLEHPALLEAILEPIERAAQKARDQHQQTLEFLRAYQKGPQQ